MELYNRICMMCVMAYNGFTVRRSLALEISVRKKNDRAEVEVTFFKKRLVLILQHLNHRNN